MQAFLPIRCANVYNSKAIFLLLNFHLSISIAIFFPSDFHRKTENKKEIFVAVAADEMI